MFGAKLIIWICSQVRVSMFIPSPSLAVIPQANNFPICKRPVRSVLIYEAAEDPHEVVREQFLTHVRPVSLLPDRIGAGMKIMASCSLSSSKFINSDVS
jgi:hypothetical protein